MITFLNVLLWVLKSVEVLAVTLMIAIGIDLGVYMYKESRPQRRGLTNVVSRIVARVIQAFNWIKLVPKNQQKRREQLRVIKLKETEAHEGFFEESYVRGFDSNGKILYRGCQVLSEKGRAYNKMMDEIDELVDGQIFDNTKEL